MTDGLADITDQDRAAAAQMLAAFEATVRARRGKARADFERQQAEDEEQDHRLRDITRAIFERGAAQARQYRLTAPEGDQQHSGQAPGQHFSPDEHRRIMEIWHRAGAVEQEHTAEHLRLALPPHGKVATLTRREITGPAEDREAIRAAILTGAMLWGGAHLSGDREGQLWGKAYAEVLGVTKATTEAVFTRAEQDRLKDIIAVVRADEAVAAGDIQERTPGRGGPRYQSRQSGRPTDP